MTDAVPPLTDAQRQATEAEARAAKLLAYGAERAKVSLTRFLYVDHGGIVRGKAAATARLAERTESGIGHTRAMMAMSMMDELARLRAWGRSGRCGSSRAGTRS